MVRFVGLLARHRGCYESGARPQNGSGRVSSGPFPVDAERLHSTRINARTSLEAARQCRAIQAVSCAERCHFVYLRFKFKIIWKSYRNNFMRVLITGVAGFIGFHTAKRFLSNGEAVLGIDNLNGYYDVALKRGRLDLLKEINGFQFEYADISDHRMLEVVFDKFRPQKVVHLAAQAGVRYSLENPHVYGESNLVGFLNVLECCRQTAVDHLVYASSSSVYGANSKIPFSVEDAVDHPMSLYAATKKANELMAHAYSHLYRIPCTGLRFFTVYGPWGRPDMAPFLFTRAILEGRAIDVYNHGDMKRDFTYIDDVVEGIVRLLPHAPKPCADGCGDSRSSTSPVAPYKVYNIGNSQPVTLLHFIRVLESCLGAPAKLNLMPMQPGDVPVTFADTSDLTRDIAYFPSTTLEMGLPRFVSWYTSFYGTELR